MEVKEAVRLAKTYVIDLYEDEDIHDVGLEEIDSDVGDCWNITIGFSREWDRGINPILRGQERRSFKVIRINDDNGKMLSIKNRVSPNLGIGE